LGGCIVAHSDASLSLPEMRSGENALLGGGPQEIVNCILEAVEDRLLRRKLGNNGREMFLEQFSADAVASELSSRIDAIRDANAVQAPSVRASV
jgi:glycosyltransferase involved in cell wall biosynthesis